MSRLKLILASSAAHMHNHMAINFIIAILPAFQAALILNYTQTELIATVFSSPTLFQPLTQVFWV